ncbi:hypothetical protein WA026_008122 [Henosepilachna vigintioctopunctata]|uniref:Endonuclease/exonuclease/phosphatase domain-containing protein n=1 Tax=Henosepilachna vigintioctopunctata TaxID=420089 RepID=A0AAW1TQD8_9CUCU
MGRHSSHRKMKYINLNRFHVLLLRVVCFILDDLRKIKCIDHIRLDNIRRYLSLQDHEDDSISETEERRRHSAEIISNGVSSFHEQPRKSSSTNGVTNGINTAVLTDIYELLSVYSSRPIINEIFRHSRNGKPAFRVSSWNLQNFSLEKASNLGVKEVVCRTLLENGLSILAIQNVEIGVALKLICEELNNPSLQRIEEWKSNSRHWKYDMLEYENGNLGFIYDGGGGNCTKLLSSEKGPPELNQYCEAMVINFEISNSTLHILNLKVKEETKCTDVQECVQKLLTSETNYLICGDFSSSTKHIDILSNLEDSQLVLLKNTRNHLHSRTNIPKYCTSNFVINACLQKHFTGLHGVIRHGLTHLAIPSGWSWGGYVSSYCPIWVEFFVNPEEKL